MSNAHELLRRKVADVILPTIPRSAKPLDPVEDAEAIKRIDAGIRGTAERIAAQRVGKFSDTDARIIMRLFEHLSELSPNALLTIRDMANWEANKK